MRVKVKMWGERQGERVREGEREERGEGETKRRAKRGSNPNIITVYNAVHG